MGGALGGRGAGHHTAPGPAARLGGCRGRSGSRSPPGVNLINAEELDGVWDEEETIGWVYQYSEPMPGEREMLEEFARSLEPTVLGQLVEAVFDKMKLAGEAGSLLKIEEEIEDAIARARAQWQREFDRATDRRGNELLLTHSEMDRLSSRANTQMDLFDVSQVTDEEFWQRAEEQVIEALRSYSTGATNGESYQRKLFTDDAAQGFAFVDICRKRFDVVLMNPPFGDASKPSKAYIEKNYPRTKNDVYAAFVERGLE